ncbi:hypothetical protein HGP14_24055 [Rhizobium sp. P32RR-XVIII]|uniref:hypothetical protein n=1 Tax=Rhizobium sp. P32RR-XVIII TaxID=2726738 RepID=UPI0014565136|nr:hypothetical protein [Rhizobium sp. P32RR-XVIII]NLS06386.1 hypothetical protein [Rhizobium sp. P32RR-XVIII]
MVVSLIRLSGLVAAPLIWAANTQLGQILPYSDCRTHVPLSAAVSILLTLVTVVAALSPLAERTPVASRTPLFVNRLSLLTGLAFSFAMLMQSAATLLIDTCQR